MAKAYMVMGYCGRREIPVAVALTYEAAMARVYGLVSRRIPHGIKTRGNTVVGFDVVEVELL